VTAEWKVHRHRRDSIPEKKERTEGEQAAARRRSVCTGLINEAQEDPEVRSSQMRTRKRAEEKSRRGRGTAVHRAEVGLE